MQHRPKLWFVLLIVLLVGSFEIGFQPIRRLPRAQDTGQAILEYDLGEPAASDRSELGTKLSELRTKLEENGLTALDKVEFVGNDPSRLRVTTIVLDETQKARDQSLALSTLQKEFKKAKIVESPQKTEKPKDLVAKLGPIGIYRPKPQVRLGLDLQGGAHVVLQCMPSTEMTFATPEDYPMYKGEGTEGSEEKAPAEKAEVEQAGGEQSTGQPSSSAGKEEKPQESAQKWDPGETKQSLTAKLEKLLQEAGVKHFEVSLPAPNRVLVKTQTTTEEQVRAEHKLVWDWLQAKYPKVKVDAPEPTSVFVKEDTAAKAKHIIDMRVYSMSDVREPIVQTQGNDRIIVELPGVDIKDDPERVNEILRSTAQLEFRLVPERYTPRDADVNDSTYWEDSNTGGIVTESQVLAESEIKFTGSQLKPNAAVIPGQRGPGDFEVRFELKEAVKRDFATFTRENVGRIMSIVLDGETKMAPVIRSEIPGTGVISGDMDAQEAGDLRLLLNAGALPVPLEIVENRQVSATLGADSVHQSMVAALGGMAAVVLFMLFYYRLPGLLADIALFLYVLLMIAAVSTWSPLEATLTLPGIAGIILSIGMAVDANVIIFERLKEELRQRTTLRAAAEAGFSRAWTAILDANVTTLMVAAALYFLGTSAIKSFAIMLFLGVTISLFTAVTVTRWLVFMFVRTKIAENRWWFGVPSLPTQAPEAVGGAH
ncbi:MAG: protein translocase subunit SecD [Candidatus Zipacnadales bacterium]